MENQNSVCYVARVNEIKPIEGADNIELLVVGGWNCINKKGEYKVGDLTIITTTDAVIPQALSDEMGVTNYLRKGGRVRTVKLRGVYSECLIIHYSYTSTVHVEGDDLMKELGISKYEPPVKMVQLADGRKVKYKDNPNFHVYYKFPNFKNVPGIFTEDDYVEITRKIHGTNARYGIVLKNKLSLWDRFKKFIGVADKWIDYEFVYGSHNVEKGSDSQGFYDTDVWRTIADRYNIKSKLWKLVDEQYTFPEFIGTGFIIYGEIYGKGIQKNYEYGLDDIRFAGFDIEVNGEYLDTGTTVSHFMLLGLQYVPILDIDKWSQELQDKYTFNQFINNTKVPHEGIVIKHLSGDRKRVAKVINPDYHIYAEKKDVGDSH